MRNSIRKKFVYYLAGMIAVIFVWEIIAFIKREPLLFPHITTILKDLSRLLFSSQILVFLVTIIRIVISLMIAFLIAFLITCLYIKNKTTYAFFHPLISFMRSTPVIVISLFIFILIGASSGPYVITVFLSLPLATQGLIDAIDKIDGRIIDELRLNNNNYFVSLRYVYIPLMKGSFITCLIQTFGLSFKVMITGEYICQTPNSVGTILYNLKSNLDMAALLAWMVLITLIVMGLEVLLLRRKNLDKIVYN